MSFTVVESTKGTPEYWLKDIEYGIRTRIYENRSGAWQEDTMDNAGWICVSNPRPRPLPDTDDRDANEAYAKRHGFYWMECPMCGEMRGGHETERNRACERRFVDRVSNTLSLYDHPLKTAAIGLLSAEAAKLRLAEMASTKHFFYGMVAFGCACGTAAQHDNDVAALSYRLWTRKEGD